jgi:hypothetical protein
MLEAFQAFELPAPQELYLHEQTIQLFTQRELSIWGTKGGWRNLTSLGLSHAEHLIALVGTTPRLEVLWMAPSGLADNNQFGEVFNAMKVGTPFGSVRKLTFAGLSNHIEAPQSRRIVPWCILKHLSELKILNIARFRFDSVCPGPTLDVPNTCDIGRIRDLCPNLETFRLNVALTGPYAECPYDNLTELARFKKSLILSLVVHRMKTRRARIMNNVMDYLAVGKHVREERRPLGLPCERPHRVDFNVVVPWPHLKRTWRLPDFRVKSYKGVVGAYSRSAW